MVNLARIVVIFGTAAVPSARNTGTKVISRILFVAMLAAIQAACD